MVPDRRKADVAVFRPSRFLGNDEPAIGDILADDMVVRLMARDGVAAADIHALLGSVRERVCPLT